MAFPTTSTLDAFNRADTGPPPSASWTTDPWAYGAAGHKVVSNQCRGNGASDNHSRWNPGTVGPDCEVWATLATRPGVGGGQEFSLIARLNGTTLATADGYSVLYEQLAGTDTVKIRRHDNGSPTVLTTINQDFANGDALGLEIIGSTLTAYRKPAAGSWASIGSTTDGTYTGAGSLELYTFGSTAVADDFGGGTIVAAADSLAGSLGLMGCGV